VVLKGFKSFMLRGDVVVISIGLIVATAFNTLIKAFTDSVITPLVARAEGKHSIGLGVQLGQYPPSAPTAAKQATFLNFGNFISAIVYFLIFMTVVYFVLVVPYRAFQARRGVTVFGDPTPGKTCPECLSEDLPLAASRCRYCASEIPVA
jgi:large conductance mechanosensitive channel